MYQQQKPRRCTCEQDRSWNNKNSEFKPFTRHLFSFAPNGNGTTIAAFLVRVNNEKKNE